MSGFACIPCVGRAGLFLLGRLHLLPGDAKALAVREVQGCLPVDVPDDGGGLLSCVPLLALQRLIWVQSLTHGSDVPHVLGLVARESVCAGKLYLSTELASSACEECEGEFSLGRGNPGQDSP